MKKAQGPIGIVIGLFVLVILLFIFLIFSRGSTTGGVVTEFEENKVLQNYIDAPFELRAWVISSDGIRLDIENTGATNYVIEVIEIVGCGTSDIERTISAGRSELFGISCQLEEGTEFNGFIKIIYSGNNGETMAVSGSLRDFV